MRQLCNVTYYALTNGMPPKDKERFDAELVANPRSVPRSTGTRELMALMGAQRGRTA